MNHFKNLNSGTNSSKFGIDQLELFMRLKELRDK